MLKYAVGVDQTKIDADLKSMVLKMANMIDFDLVATCGFRTPEKNAEVGGVANSSHLKGLAIDILTSSSAQTYKIVASALICGFRRIGVAKDHIHLDIDKEKVQEILFLEN